MSVPADFGTRPKLVIISGMSGAGRTEAIHVFEDLDYYCVDNLPAGLLSNLLTVASPKEGQSRDIAVVCDTRNKEFFQDLQEEILALDRLHYDYRILFLEASDEILVARYKFSRRRHPMSDDGSSIMQGIAKEREVLSWIKQKSDFVLDTTAMLPGKLRSSIRELFSNKDHCAGLNVTVYSFGFKYGAPLDADLVMDVRFLPNPYWDEKLKDHTGLEQEVKDFVLFNDTTTSFVRSWQSLLDCVMPGYINEGKQQLTIAIGCTGGQHRSVVIAEVTGDYLKSKGYSAGVTHRDMSKASQPR